MFIHVNCLQNGRALDLKSGNPKFKSQFNHQRPVVQKPINHCDVTGVFPYMYNYMLWYFNWVSGRSCNDINNCFLLFRLQRLEVEKLGYGLLYLFNFFFLFFLFFFFFFCLARYDDTSLF